MSPGFRGKTVQRTPGKKFNESLLERIWIEMDREREEERGAQCIMGVPQQSKPIAA